MCVGRGEIGKKMKVAFLSVPSLCCFLDASELD